MNPPCLAFDVSSIHAQRHWLVKFEGLRSDMCTVRYGGSEQDSSGQHQIHVADLTYSKA